MKRLNALPWILMYVGVNIYPKKSTLGFWLFWNCLSPKDQASGFLFTPACVYYQGSLCTNQDRGECRASIKTSIVHCSTEPFILSCINQNVNCTLSACSTEPFILLCPIWTNPFQSETKKPPQLNVLPTTFSRLLHTPTHSCLLFWKWTSDKQYSWYM